MKHSNPAMRKPSLGKVNHDLSAQKIDTANPDYFVMTCQNCNHTWVFKQKDIPYGVIKCPECGYEEIFMRNNFEWVEKETLNEAAKPRLNKVFADYKG